MRKGLRALAILATVMTAMIWSNMAPSYARGATVATAAGTISPGIPGPTAAAVTNSVSLTGTATGWFGTVVGSCALAYSGTGPIDFVMGSVTGTMTCNGPSVAILCSSSSFTIIGTYWMYLGSCAGFSASTIWFCQAAYNNINPTTSIGLVCEIIGF